MHEVVTRAKQAEAAMADKWRRSQLRSEEDESDRVRERVVAKANGEEVVQLRSANAALESVADGLRADLRLAQRQLDEERAASNRELERLRQVIAATQSRANLVAATSGAPSAGGVLGVMSPARPMKL